MIHLRKFAFSEAKNTAISVTGYFLIITEIRFADDENCDAWFVRLIHAAQTFIIQCAQ